MTDQRSPQLGDWTVCQDTETVQTSIRTNSIDSINQLNVLDRAIADFKNGGEEPYIYVPNRVYALDTASRPVAPDTPAAQVGFQLWQHTLEKASLVFYDQVPAK